MFYYICFFLRLSLGRKLLSVVMEAEEEGGADNPCARFSIKFFYCNYIFQFFYTPLHSSPSIIIKYCRSGNIREVLIFAYFARRTNSRIQESRENYKNATEEKWKFPNSELRK